ncbi:M67 family metallopeptidase [Candidatus Chloroploca asiatica]|uniref:MPN domain-containing protein n=1 Tax=Candidatus Chloroploca asiatica TaxID=1506545 RepID=A0A2H3KIB5_9CHLR|nr:M67 family metallopeptidase [Candidatus Chloroploca asiatica]PDV97589.1 hypothetical protein A9Q02_03805 [Candidatus Chloroploca asiatica]
MIRVASEAANTIARHAEATYPDECVGLLLGHFDGEDKVVSEAFPVENRWAGQMSLAETDDPTSRRDRFYLDPRDYMRADRAAQARGLDIVGCYHSHPDHPPTPSERDRIGAQAIAGPGFAFAIQAVEAGQATSLASWCLLDGGEAFVEETLVLEDGR